MTPATAVADKVRSALARELKRDPATIAPEHALREDLGLNSLDAIELMFKVEEEFDLEIPDADLQHLRTVGDLISYLEARLQGAPGGRPASTPAEGPPAAPASAPRPPRAAAAPRRTRVASSAAARPAAKRRSGPGPASGKRSRS
jgi:acyl carrier protein